MESLPQSSPLREFYPEDSYPGGEPDHLPLTVIVFTVIYIQAGIIRLRLDA
jgi:hypothetical protein